MEPLLIIMDLKKPLLMIAAFGLIPLAASAQTTVTVNAATTLVAIPSQIYGNNMSCYNESNNGSDSTYVTDMQISGCRNLRWPGGSYADIVNWDDITCQESYYATTPQFVSFLQAFGGTMQPIVNFSGYWCNTQYSDPSAPVSLAEAWVTWNKSSAGSARATYWEIGNESYGSWEQGGQGSSGSTLTGTVYGLQFAQYYTGMKAIDSSIKIGAVAVPSSTQYGDWTPEMLAACKAAGTIPDFLIIHNYPEGVTGTGATYDAQTLNTLYLPSAQKTTLDNIVSSGLGSSYVGQVKYMMTEYNSSLGPSVQTVEYLNAMFVSQWIMECAKNGWAGANLWAAKNGASGAGGPDYGFLDANTDNPHPDYYVFPLLTGKFGTQMVSCSSSTTTVRAYAARDSSSDLTLFLVNNSPTAATTATINISGFYPEASGSAWVLLPQGTAPPGAPQEATGIQINGTANPSPSAVVGIAGASQATAPSFAVPLQPSEMVLLVIPEGATPTPTVTPTPTSTPTPCGYPGNTCTPTATPTPTNTPFAPGPVVAVPNILRDGQTQTVFQVPEPGATLTVTIYDLAGEKVVGGTCSQGSSRCSWNCNGVASGLYIARVQVTDADGSNRKQTLKLLVLH